MQYRIIVSDDGSNTIFIPELNENYHSTRGAVEEALHVYINNGFCNVNENRVNILEVGFGTGLNALLTVDVARQQAKSVYYECIELFPIQETIWKQLNYTNYVSNDSACYFEVLHKAEWGRPSDINNYFELLKLQQSLLNYSSDNLFDVIYFDAFAPDIQPEMWTLDVFRKMKALLKPDGILVTYSSKGSVKNNLRNAGFIVKRLKGAGGKRHMIKAINQQDI